MCNKTCVCPASQIQTVTLIPGDGIGPEISNAVMKIFEAAKVSTGKTVKKKERKSLTCIFIFQILSENNIMLEH